MSIAPIITFKAGKCDADYETSPPRIKPNGEPGFLYLYNEDDLVHFCWRPRNASLANPEIDLNMVPTDGSFKPYLGADKVANKSPVKGRIFVLKFASSSQRYFFWLQSREQPRGEPSQFSQRDLRLGQIVHNLLQGDDVDASSEIENLRNQRSSGRDGDEDDDAMDDAPSGEQDSELDRAASGGAGADATGGDVREEGEEAREGGADGGRADSNVNDQTTAAVRNFLESLRGGAGLGSNQQGRPFTTLADLLSASSTLPMIEGADSSYIEELLVRHLPSALVFLEHQVDDIPETQADQETVRESVQALEPEQQKDILRRVLRSPQFFQGLMSLTAALRDGGLPTVSEALGVEVQNGGYTGPDRSVPLSGGDAVEAFLEGIKKLVERSNRSGGSS